MTGLEKPPEFLFQNVGSHGDILPLLGIASELVRRGHRCQLLGNEHFREEANARGVGFYAIASERTHSPVPGNAASYLYFKFDGVHDYFQKARAFDDRTVVVSTHAFGALEPLAEAHRLRTLRLTLFPVRIKSLISPPWPLGKRACGPDGETFLKVTLPAMYRAADSHPEVLARLCSIRAQVGLPPARSATFESRHVVAHAAMFPEWFGMPAADWPDMKFLGFPLPSSTEPLPPAVLDFLARWPRPIVFTPGTGFGTPERFFQAAARCCAELGMPGIFLSRFLHAESRQLGDHIACFDHVELEGLLRHAALIVHHGGLGTTSRALQAGIPQIISPVGFDQPDNGHRVELLGAGRVLPRDRLSGATLAAAARELLGDAEMRIQLSRYRAALAAPHAIGRAADLLESIARNTPLMRRASSAVALPSGALS